jgi:hypothetical protein
MKIDGSHVLVSLIGSGYIIGGQMPLLAVWKPSSVRLRWKELLSLSYACARTVSQAKGLSRTARLDRTTLPHRLIQDWFRALLFLR